MNKEECVDRCRKILSQYDGKFDEKISEYEDLKFDFVKEPKRKISISIRLDEFKNDEGVIGAIHFEIYDLIKSIDDEMKPIKEWQYGGAGYPYESYYELLKDIENRIKEQNIKKKEVYQPTLFDCL